ncbi:hypothetical protein [Fusibacter ferrireducens]|uniref:Uncharacterized protein n=1 Tax=Fusibacter ferrireducens TaxID=2785058 RepID=A0ABR9ZPV9_9FIRM|nr:hypothetical protein [Fusibacter ferrireducens]MBF4691965.1 hypothetical protein [Fusibacter ferrireducens]
MTAVLLIILIIANYPLYKFFFSLMFDTTDDFWECLRYYFTPDLFSLFRGEYFKDRVSEMRIGSFLVLCGLCVFIEFAVIKNIFGM